MRYDSLPTFTIEFQKEALQFKLDGRLLTEENFNRIDNDNGKIRCKLIAVNFPEF
jgi:hypothetical protein